MFTPGCANRLSLNIAKSNYVIFHPQQKSGLFFATNLGAIVLINTAINTGVSSSCWWLLQGEYMVRLIETEYKQNKTISEIQYISGIGRV